MFIFKLDRRDLLTAKLGEYLSFVVVAESEPASRIEVEKFLKKAGQWAVRQIPTWLTGKYSTAERLGVVATRDEARVVVAQIYR